MGSWSVYCGVSNITIGYNDKCILLPLKINTGRGDNIWSPATLPIEGRYNDYGGITDIIEDDSTKLIEEHLGITIKEFTEYLVDGKFTFNRSNYHKIKNKLDEKALEEISNWRFMFIDQEVYYKLSGEIMITDNLYGEMPVNSDLLLKDLGFKFIKKNYYTYNDQEYIIKGDILMKEGHKYYDLGDLFNEINYKGEFEYLSKYIHAQGCKYLSVPDLYNYVFFIIGGDYTYHIDKKLRDDFDIKYNHYNTLTNKYIDNYKIHIDKMVRLVVLNRNLYSMSNSIEPLVLYKTPQTPHHEEHLKMVEIFQHIIKSRVE